MSRDSIDSIEDYKELIKEHAKIIPAIRSDVHSTAKAVDRISQAFDKFADTVQQMQINNAEFAALVKQNVEIDRRNLEYLEKKIEENKKAQEKDMFQLKDNLLDKVQTLHEEDNRRIEGLEKKLWWGVALIVGSVILGVVDLVFGGTPV